MNDNKKITGVFFSDLLNGLDDFMPELMLYAKNNLGISIIWSFKDFPCNNIQKTVEEIRKNRLTHLILAGNTPGMYKNFFAKSMILAGNNPDDVILVSFRDYGIIEKEDINRAKAVLLCAAYNVSFETLAVPEETDVCKDTLVIGGGIAGIQASLEIADGNNKVYLVEKSGTIGGYMATFDKTFPTLDCAACILTPKMVEVGQHPYIELMTYCEVKDVSGEPGNYKVKILKKARRVSLAACIGCGNCTTKCPSVVYSEFDAGTTMRKAIYIPFPQAVPNKYLIDAYNCRYVKEKKCGVCVKACPVNNCINLEEKDEEVEITVGNIIVATGFKPFDAKKTEQYGYGKYPNVVTSLEFERLVNASGPTGGKIRYRSKDKKGNWIFSADSGEPESIAIIHCIGSRDVNYNKYCSRVCCMYSLKLAHLVKEKLHHADVYEYFIDMRAFGKGYEEFYERIKKEGVHIIRGRTAKIEEKDNQLLLRGEDILMMTCWSRKLIWLFLLLGLNQEKMRKH